MHVPPGRSQPLNLTHLLLRKLARVVLDCLRRFLINHPPCQILLQSPPPFEALEISLELRHANRLPYPDTTRAVRVARAVEMGQFLEHARLEHFVHPAGEVLVQHLSRYIHPDEAAAVTEFGGGRTEVWVVRNVTGRDEGVDEGVGPASDDGQFVAFVDFRDSGIGDGSVIGRWDLDVGVELTEEMVGHTAAILHWDLVRRDVEAFMELDFVCVDDFGGESSCYVNGESGFSTACSPHDHNNL